MSIWLRTIVEHFRVRQGTNERRFGFTGHHQSGLRYIAGLVVIVSYRRPYWPFGGKSLSSGRDTRKTMSVDATPDMATSQDGGTSAASDGGHTHGKTKSGAKSAEDKDRDMGSALRSVYQRTIDEAIPDEMLDILGKLH